VEIPRSEYPRPQMVRDSWINLNGVWDFEIDHNKIGLKKEFFKQYSLKDNIIVPFCPESKLSTIEHTNFMECIWYKKEITLPLNWKNKKTLLNIGACDYKTTLWVNSSYVGVHKGGYSSFTFDITPFLDDNMATITLMVEDDIQSGLQPSGKQSKKLNSHGCYYSRTTGIWQSVWLESVSHTYINNFNFFPNPDDGKLKIKMDIEGDISSTKLMVKAFLNNTLEGSHEIIIDKNSFSFVLDLNNIALWDINNPILYDISFELFRNDISIDKVTSYFGLKNVSFTNNVFLLNDQPIFLRLVLDQGFYPEGIYTAPSDEAFKKDILLSKDCGFNGARLHEKVFDPRFLYWADRLGYIVWEEHANWGLDITTINALENFVPEWKEIINRDFNHPCIIGWCPFNETWNRKKDDKPQDDIVLKEVYTLTKTLDETRPCIDTSGNFHVVTDIYDIHDYEQDISVFKSHYLPMITDKSKTYNTHPDRQTYNGKAFFISEYGGIKWSNTNKEGWGYGNDPQTEKEFISRYRQLSYTLLDNPHICGFCYTQLYDVEQELNGLYTYDRLPKFDMTVFKKINSKKAAIEF